jgi:hypothetical protein
MLRCVVWEELIDVSEVLTISITRVIASVTLSARQSKHK